jgi:LPXTG-motif cell wall-anchored protein
MKKATLILSMAAILLMVNAGIALSQDKPKPKKDTVNMDSNAKPQQFYAVEDDKPAPAKSGGSTAVIIIVAGAAVVLGGTVFFVMKKKKK